MAIYKNKSFVDDKWRMLADGEGVSASGNVIFTLEWWQAEKQIFDGSKVPLGLRLAPSADLHALADDVSRFSLIVLEFPKFGDGRAFSLARLLRERYGFTGELRAAGEILADQIQPMLRCGFDSFEISDEKTEKALRERRIPGVTHFYQPGCAAEAPAGHRPWAREIEAI